MMDDQLFFAWLDGELEAAKARDVEAAVAASPDLQVRAAAHRALRTKLSQAFDPIAAAPLPASLLAAAAPRGEVVDFGAEREMRRGARLTPIWAQWGALAATLALGLFAGSTISPNSPPLVREGGQLVASAGLEEALYTRLASAPAADGPRIGLTFRDASGKLCRSFTDQMSSGLACREGGDWRIRGLFQAPEGQSGQFRMAAGQDPHLAELIASTMAGEPLDAAAERRAMEGDWR